MAVSMDGFSIRGYTAKMRSVDVVKCWPFNDSTNEDHVRAILPPITVKKFRWWLDVLQESDDNVDGSDVVPLGNIRKAKAFKGKARVQKKRSIIDIFAVAPQVGRLDDVDYYDDDDDDDCATLNCEKDEVHISAVTNLKSKKRDPNKKKKTSGSKLKEVKKLIKKEDKQFKQKKKVKTNNCLDLLISNKEKLDKLKVPNSLSKPSCSQHNKKRGNEADWKPQRKLPVSEKKTKSLANSKCSAKHQKMAIPVCNKVKKRTKRYPVENLTSGNSCGPNDSNLCNNQQVDKPVTFSDLSTRERGEVLSLVVEKATNRYIVETTDNEVTPRPGSPKQLSIVCSTADISAKDNSVEFCDIFNQVAEESDNSNLFRRGYWVASNGSQYICNSVCHHMPQEMHKKDQLVGSLINASCANEISHEQLKGSIREVAGICSMHSPTITGNCNGCFMQYQPFHQVSPQDLMCKICSSSERKHRESIYGENRNEEDYVSLPLNSQGELVNPNSNGKRKLTQQSSSRGIVTSSNEAALSKCMDNLSDGRGWDRQTPPTHQLKLSFVDDSMEWSPTFPVPSRLGIYDYDAGRTNVELDPLKETEEPITPELNCNVSNLSSHRSKQGDQPETNWSQQYGHSDQVSLLVTPSKLRLMGKEFTVGSRDFHVPQDKGIWTDKRIIAENFPAGTYNYNSVVTNHDRQMLTVHPVLGTLKGPVSCSPSIHINQAIPSSRVCTPHFSRQIDSVQPHCLGAINQNPFSFYNQKPPNFEEPCIGEYRSLSISPYAPLPASIHHYSCQNGVSNSVEVNSSRCAINFPLLRLDSGTGIQSHESTAWLSNAKEKKLQMELHQLNSASSKNHQYCSITGDNRQIDPLVSFAPERFCSLTQCPQPSLENPVASPHLASYPPMPLHIGSRQNVGTNKRNGGDMMKLKEKIISTPCLRDPRHSKMAKRTLLSESYSCTNSTKIPNLGIREEPPVGLTPFHSDFEGHFNCRQAFESGSVKGLADNIQSGQRRTPDARFGSFDGEVTFKYNCPLKSGPVRLIPGAKHVLRPCQYNDQNFWPAHSTIPFDASTAGSRTLETAKPTKIYKF